MCSCNKNAWFTGFAARRCNEPVEVVGTLRERMSDGERQVNVLFESLMA